MAELLDHRVEMKCNHCGYIRHRNKQDDKTPSWHCGQAMSVIVPREYDRSGNYNKTDTNYKVKW